MIRFADSITAERFMIDAFKKKLQQDDAVLVINADHPYPSLVEFLGRLPVDAVFIDCEQGSADIETVENLARAARLGGLTSLARIFSPEDWVIERYMGRGVDGIVVPRVDTVEQAAGVVDAVRYCYPKSWQEKAVVVQIETRSALDALDAMLRLDGIDCYFIGPVDLAKSLGYEGDYRHRDVQQAMNDVIARIREAGKVAGIMVDRGNVGAYVQAGVRFLYAHVNDFLSIGAADFAAAMRGA